MNTPLTLRHLVEIMPRMLRRPLPPTPPVEQRPFDVRECGPIEMPRSDSSTTIAYTDILRMFHEFRKDLQDVMDNVSHRFDEIDSRIGSLEERIRRVENGDHSPS